MPKLQENVASKPFPGTLSHYTLQTAHVWASGDEVDQVIADHLVERWELLQIVAATTSGYVVFFKRIVDSNNLTPVAL